MQTIGPECTITPPGPSQYATELLDRSGMVPYTLSVPAQEMFSLSIDVDFALEL